MRAHTYKHTQNPLQTRTNTYTDLSKQKDTQYALKDTDMNMNATQAKKRKKDGDTQELTKYNQA